MNSKRILQIVTVSVPTLDETQDGVTHQVQEPIKEGKSSIKDLLEKRMPCQKKEEGFIGKLKLVKVQISFIFNVKKKENIYRSNKNRIMHDPCIFIILIPLGPLTSLHAKQGKSYHPILNWTSSICVCVRVYWF